MNPGASVWSAAINKRIKPRSHILLEPEVRYEPIMKKFTKSHPGSYWLPLDGYDWNTYSKLFASKPPGSPWPADFPSLNPLSVPPEDGINTDIIFTANLSMAGSDGDRLLSQFLTCCALGQWVQQFGRVRFLVWAQDALRDRYLPRGVGGRNRTTVVAETVAEVHEVVSSLAPRTGKGHPRACRLDAEGNRPPPKQSRFKSPKGITKRIEDEEAEYATARRSMSVEELNAAISNIEESRGIYEERGKKRKSRTPLELRHTRLNSQDLERMRRRLLHVIERESDPEVTNLFEKLAESDSFISQRTDSLVTGISGFLNDPQGSQRWLAGMKHPPWWYRLKESRVIDLAGELAKGRGRSTLTNRFHIQQVELQTMERLEALQAALQAAEPSQPTDPLIQQQNKEAFDQFQDCWTKPSNKIATMQSAEDEVLAFKKGLLMWVRRKFESVVAENSDFYPPLPLTLLDFAPIEMGEFFRPQDPNLRVGNWEVYLWVLRSLFLLRARSLGAALVSMAPGGGSLLELVDQNMAIDKDMRVRVVKVSQFVELARAWRECPFYSMQEHLEPQVPVNHMQDDGRTRR